MKTLFTRQLAHPQLTIEVDLLLDPLNVTVWAWASPPPSSSAQHDAPPIWVECVSTTHQVERVLNRAGVRKTQLAAVFMDTPDYAKEALCDMLWPADYAKPRALSAPACATL